MAEFGCATCDFAVDETQDGQRRLIAVKPHENIALLDRGKLTFELNPEFQLGDAQVLAKLLKDWITQVRYEPIA